ncbi:MAG: ECF transporter S component [Clostridia bacterium]|nr:ECF transporter S component [Clostridia bacterium]
MKKNELKNLVTSAMLLALGLVLPFLTGQIQQIGNMLLPMHFPVILCGLICGWKYGLGVGFVMPLLRSVIFGMPVMYPNAFAMAFELAAYGFFAGFLFSHAKWQCIKSLYRCLITSMLLGRAVWGIVMTIILGLGADGFTLTAFLTSAFINAIPGIIAQLVLIPAIMLALDKTHFVRFKNTKCKMPDARYQMPE